MYADSTRGAARATITVPKLRQMKANGERIVALTAYDARQQTSLVETLAAYFAHHGNLSRTAEALFLHRNTLLYRMERIAAIIGHDLDDPEVRLMLQVAFKVQQLL